MNYIFEAPCIKPICSHSLHSKSKVFILCAYMNLHICFVVERLKKKFQYWLTPNNTNALHILLLFVYLGGKSFWKKGCKAFSWIHSSHLDGGRTVPSSIKQIEILSAWFEFKSQTSFKKKTPKPSRTKSSKFYNQPKFQNSSCSENNTKLFRCLFIVIKQTSISYPEY